MSIEKTHERCAICDWLGREAERTAEEQGTDHWSSCDRQRDGTEHAAHYLAEVGLTEKNTEKEQDR